MKKLIIVVIALINTTPSFAEDLVSLGVGINFNTYGGDVNVDGEKGYGIGLGYTHLFTDTLGIYVGLRHSTRGMTLGNNEDDIAFIDIPVALTYKIAHAGGYYSLGRIGLAQVLAQDDEVWGAKINDGIGLYIGADVVFPFNGAFSAVIQTDAILGLYDVFELPSGEEAGDLFTVHIGAAIAFSF